MTPRLVTVPSDCLILRRAERRCARLPNTGLIGEFHVALKRCDEAWANIIHAEIKRRENAGFLTEDDWKLPRHTEG
jgi:hypothetical protein